MSKNNKLGVGVVHELCPCCLKEINYSVVVNQRLSVPEANKVNEMNGKAIGFSEKPCEECQTNLDNGFTLLIGIDPSKSEPSPDGTVNLHNVYRTGTYIWLRNSVIKEVFGQEPTMPFLLVEEEVFSELRVDENTTLLDAINQEKMVESSSLH